jgi:poly-gamma-glutamate synthesis protein (capsule biosynthesis protein)
LLDIEKLIIKIAEVRKLVQRIVVYIHWGIEESSYPAKEDILIARKLIDAGANIIIGSHAHAPQPIEKYNNGIIAYNLGNFIMPEFKNIPTYFSEKGLPQSTYSKKLMIWNRVSWGLIIDMDSLEFKVNKYISLFKRVILIPYSPLDKYLLLKKDPIDISFTDHLNKHMKKRKSFRKIIEFLYNPHIPERIRKHL